MAAKLIRQPDQLVVVGAPTSAGAAAAGVERAPSALREVGILEQLKAAGYRVTDAGDLPEQIFQPDPENPRAQNLSAVLAVLEALRVRVEQATRAHALLLILGGDATIPVALVAGLRRQAPSVGLVHISRHADLHTPTATQDGLIGPMTVSHLVGQGAAELVRFWKSPPLVREPDLVAFGRDETDAIDRQRLGSLAIRDFPLARIRSLGARAAAGAALEHLRSEGRDYVVHLSWDIFSPQGIPGCARGAADGLTAHEAREALRFFAAHEKFAGLSISDYNPELDPERVGARAAVGLVADALAARLAALLHPEAVEKEIGEKHVVAQGHSDHPEPVRDDNPAPGETIAAQQIPEPAAAATSDSSPPGAADPEPGASIPPSPIESDGENA